MVVPLPSKNGCLWPRFLCPFDFFLFSSFSLYNFKEQKEVKFNKVS